MIEKAELLKLLKKESNTTLKAMRAFPEDKLSFAPHERSSNAGKVIRTFVFEMYLIEAYVLGEKKDRSIFQNYMPDKLAALISDYEKESNYVISKLSTLENLDLGKSVQFAGTEMRADEFILFMIFDQIHHRGQLSVYIRMAGGKVPSVYGPSADDSSTNL